MQEHYCPWGVPCGTILLLTKRLSSTHVYPCMDGITILIKARPGARIPEYKTGGAAGADVFALLDSPLRIKPGETKMVPTGMILEIPDGFEAQIRPRSGLAIRHGITLMNTPGTIDSDYRGEVQILVTNHGREDFVVENGMRIAQMVFNRVFRGTFVRSENLSSTERNDGGFGHSGV